MSHRTVSLVFLLLVAGTPLARPDDAPTLSSDSGWQRAEEKSAVTIYSRVRVGSGIKEFKGTGLIDASPDLVEKVLRDVASYPTFMPYVTEARVISQSGTQIVTYQRLDLPFISNRDYTIRVEHGISKNPAGFTIYRDTWQTDNEAGPPERIGLVRVKINEGSWLLEPAGPIGASTQATYQIYTDSGGVVPSFLVNRGSQTAIPKLFEAIRKRVQDPKYQH